MFESLPIKKEFTWPVWGIEEKFLVSIKDVTGATSMWATKQSPYKYPHRLGPAMLDLEDALKIAFKFDDMFAETTIEELRVKLIAIFESVEDIANWNKPKIQTDNIVQGSISGHHTTKPDYDFIDLHALARNVAHTIGREHFY